MGFTTLQMLWLLPVFTLTAQELVKLKVSPRITAECGQQVTLNCSVSSSQPGLSIKHMEWSHNKASLCSVDSEGNTTTHHSDYLSGFRCEYKDRQLSLIFQEVQPLGSGHSRPYMCKQHSNRGAKHGYTTVELQECCGKAEGVLTSDGPSCTFTHVYPDGDVHWFHGSRNLSDGSLKHNTTKSVDKHGWLMIHSNLKRRGSDVHYSCALKSTTSGRYIASIRIPKQGKMVTTAEGSPPPTGNGVGLQETIKTVLYILMFHVVTLI